MNFDYIRNDANLNELAKLCCDAESLVLTMPNLSAIASRQSLEYLTKYIYSYYLGIDHRNMTLLDMLDKNEFKNFINDNQLLNSIHYIRKMGNEAVHNNSLNVNEALKVLEELHFLVGEFSILSGAVEDYDIFIKPTQKLETPNIKKEELQKSIEVEVSEELKAEFATKLRKVKFNIRHKRDDSENKKLFLESSLREAGWALVNKENVVMPGCAAINLMLDNHNKEDYVLVGRDNKPLAIVEFTETSKNLIEGRKKAIDKANILETKYGYKPVIYYTNGYVIYCIDQLGYPPRRVFNFHSIEELELFKLRQTLRKDITNPIIDDNITNRYYQKEAINAACNAFANDRRKSLLVMATGTGKTRVSISFVDVLIKAGWVKNILFLADRTSLVKQAHKNYNKLLPNITTTIYTGEEVSRDRNARIVFSTYQTMIKLINDDTKEFSVGRFDLIIIDEAHRSIFQKYKTIFSYFDALMLGLTATPRDEENKNTYDIFDLPEGVPDYAYELEQAINDGYLVGYQLIDNTTDSIKNGIHYSELPLDIRKKIEDDDLFDIDWTKSNRSFKASDRIINTSTIDIMLHELMKDGLKVDGGDKLGKTIIFAPSHQHAVQIVERFNKIYSYLGNDFCKLVDSQMDDAQNTIERFELRDSMPQICVSVDMMDTGIDVPDVLNLVFFKKLQSKIKFMQMIGRGTRLSENIFGEGEHKEAFIIFDYFDNFEYFNTKSEIIVKKQYSLSMSINIFKLEILKQLQLEPNLLDFEKSYLAELQDYFVHLLNMLCNDSVEVQRNIAFVNKYRCKEAWENIDVSADEIQEKIIPILPNIPESSKIRSFDSLMYNIEKIYKTDNKTDTYFAANGFGLRISDCVTWRMKKLLKMTTIPEIVAKNELINSMIELEYIKDSPSLELIERVRKELRDLMIYLPSEKEYFIVNIDDKLIEKERYSTTVSKESYSTRVTKYLANSKELVLKKISNLDPLTADEKAQLDIVFNTEIGTKEECAVWCNNVPLLQRIRMEIGIDDNAIQIKFGSFLNLNVLNMLQLSFMNKVIEYAKMNGDITFKVLQQVSPFCDVDITKQFGTNSIYLKDLINGIHKPIL